ncbi:DDE-domain-containing protein [Wilcoxina mikolae CBS 423.85]|nr:DDE-domain-containing protein [Wilcoxina mikolae CBS 423.85]
MDEKGFIIGYSSEAKVICQADRWPPRVTQDRIREMLTVIKCCSAGQLILPCFVIYQGSTHYMGWHSETDDPDAVFTYFQNGWTDNVLGLGWLKEFDMWTELRAAHRLRFLILDGYRSHITLKFYEYALAIKIVLIWFPAHSTHLLQPLDVGCGHLKIKRVQQYYGKTADNHMRETRTGVVKGTFWKFYSAARIQAYTPSNIQSAWRTAGIRPFCPDAVTSKLPPQPGTFTANHAIPLITRTPRNRREVGQHTNAAISMVQSGNTVSAISILRRLAHVAETALSTAEIKSIEIDDIR